MAIRPAILPAIRPALLRSTDPRAALSGALPVNTIAPAVTGTAYPQETLATTTGTWTGSPSPSYTYQWFVGGVARSGATSATFAPGLDDIGAAVYCRVTATNSKGAVNANSNTVNVWSPSDESAVAEWWWSRAGALTSVSPDVAATNGQTVRALVGRKAGWRFEQTTGSQQPIWRATGESGGPSLEFDGANDTMAITSGSALDVFRNKGYGAIIAAARDTNPTGGDSAHVLFVVTDNGTDSRMDMVSRLSGKFSTSSQRLDTDPYVITNGPTSDSSAHVLTSVATWSLGSSGTLVLRQNGSQVASANFSGTATATSNTASSAIRIGAFSATTFRFPGQFVTAFFLNSEPSAAAFARLERFAGLHVGRNIPLV